MIADRLARHEVLLPINQNSEKNFRKKLDIGYTFSQNKKKKLTRRDARQQRVHMTRSVHLYKHDVLHVPLTGLSHCPIASKTRTLFY